MAAPLNPLVTDTATPPIPEAYGWTLRYEGGRGPMLDMAQAAPSQPPHDELLKRMAAAAGDPACARYGPILGDAPLRKAYAAEIEAIYGGPVAMEEVAITAGCSLAFLATLMTVAKAGDGILLPSPWYFGHEMCLRMLGLDVVELPATAAAGFVPDPEVAEGLIGPRTRAIVLTSPNNPTGAHYPAEVMARFEALCRKHGLWLVIDETYRDLLPAGLARSHDLLTRPSWRDHVIQLYSFSKAYCMPGHRLGALAAGRPVIAEIEKTLDTVQICAPRPSQSAVAWAIDALPDWRAAGRAELNRRADACRDAFGRLNAWRLSSIGAYFAYVQHPFHAVPGREVAERLAIERGVLALPGSYFGPGQDTHLRVAFANATVEMIGELPGRLAGFDL